MQTDVWVNITNGSFKVWLYEENQTAITTRWGRLGLPKHKLASKTKASYNPWRDGLRLAASKEAKGYVPVDAMLYWDNYQDLAFIIRIASSENVPSTTRPPPPPSSQAPAPPAQSHRRIITIDAT